MARLVLLDQPLRALRAQLRRLSPLHAVLLTLLAIGMASALPIRPADQRPPRPALANVAAVPATVAGLLAITTDSHSVVAQTDAARAANSAVPLLAGALQAARPFALAGAALTDGLALNSGAAPGAGTRAQHCLALAMYYEAGFEGRDGRAAVAQVVLNRMRHPAYPHDVCSVVFQRSISNVCQFTFACDGAMQRTRVAPLWRQSLGEAGAALRGKVYPGVGMATHYHADYVFPRWATRLEKVAVIGQHLFYRWPGGWGQRSAFSARYNGGEPALAELGAAELGVAELGLAELGLDLGLGLPGAPPLLHDLPSAVAAAAGEVAPIQSANEAGFIDPSKGWVPNIALPRAAARASPAASLTPAPAAQPAP